MSDVIMQTCLFCYKPMAETHQPNRKFCSNRCRMAYCRTQKAVTIPDKLPSPQDEPVTAFEAAPPAYPGDRIAPPKPEQHRRYGDFDVRGVGDIKGPSLEARTYRIGTAPDDPDYPELPAFLDRRRKGADT